MAASAANVIAAVAQYVSRLRVPVDGVYLFGSYAKGTADEWSDIDLAVVSPEFGTGMLADARALAAGMNDRSASRRERCPLMSGRIRARGHSCTR